MQIRCHRSERGDATLAAVLWVSGAALAIARAMIVAGIVQHRLLVTLAYLAGGFVLLGHHLTAAMVAARAANRRPARNRRAGPRLEPGGHPHHGSWSAGDPRLGRAGWLPVPGA
jgi:hypothetical protein